MTDFIQGTRHFGIVVRNLTNSITFYEELGLKIIKQMEENEQPITIDFFRSLKQLSPSDTKHILNELPIGYNS